jgi:hypothetical protein
MTNTTSVMDQDYDFEQENLLCVSTEGANEDDLQQLNIDKINLHQCLICFKYFKEDMVVPLDGQDQQCWHCLFWMNYSIDLRKQVDGAYGMSIAEYILKCKDVHTSDTCTRNSDNGGCFLCEFNIGIPITDINNLDILYEN